MIDYSLIKLIPAADTHHEFSYEVKKAAEGEYIKQMWGWDEQIQRDFHSLAWQQHKPDIIMYGETPIGTIATTESEDGIEIRQFFILPEYQNKGIGTHLLQSILDRADRLGRVARLAFLANNPVKSLYIRNGFQMVRTEDTFCYMERKPRGIK
jgi:GNAT superfamily N-acetyltransferase